MPVPRAAIVANGVDVPPLAGTPRDPSLVLYLGRVNWKKGLDRLIEAIAQVDGARLVVAGPDDEHYTASLPRHERVTFAGEVAGAEKEGPPSTPAKRVLPSPPEKSCTPRAVSAA